MTVRDPTDKKGRDTFGRPIALNIANRADLAGHYPYSPERFRVFVDGTRQFIQYDGEPAQYTDTTDSHTLKPQSDNEVVTFQTEEVYRYAVQYVLEWSAAIQCNQALQSGDVVSLGYGDADLANASGDAPGPSADGYFLVWDDTIASDEVKLQQYRGGTKQADVTAKTRNAVTDWTRWAGETNWYGVGATRFHQTSTSGGVQDNGEIGGMSIDGEKGPQRGNHPMQVSVKVGSAGAGSLEVDIGSIGVRTFGDVVPVFRRKTAQTVQNLGTADTWAPIYAVRIDPDRDIINTQLTDVRVPEFGGNGDVHVMAVAFDQSKLRDSGGNAIVDGDFSVPAEQSAQNSVIEKSTAVAQFPDSGGSIGTTATNPGGYQVGYGANYTTGGNVNKQPVSQQAKRPLPQKDIVVFLAQSGVTGDVTIEYVTEQQW